jgi:hypothetical protein
MPEFAVRNIIKHAGEENEKSESYVRFCGVQTSTKMQQ